ncbi:branched-chain amino acid aminotransferase [Parenemella sanctibonifatiensis]|uniref:Branched-chain-amino-acid aminotransferase n=1 Tax=Parenemella sanctibonifatiensis TaxID=2016505 RepID=A0A255EJ65_9ACTN|nr:branched-chain amino acid aminotransferase [Parenemella sanctibonifatiensis]OYN91280.1 branched chain amino acid aminotransferase [Parenemella sanctibonifatiensis]
MSLMFELRRNDNPVSPQQREQVLAKPGFGQYFTDHMAVATWIASDGWHDSGIVARAPFSLDPAAAVLHYAQEVFEGLKAYRWEDGSIWLFRPEQNARRMAASAHRLALPELPEEDFLASIEELVRVDQEWVPAGGESSLYLRPFMFATEVFLGVRAARQVQYCCIASPAGAYFPRGVEPVDIWISTDYTRAAPGGTGEAKCGGNYAASLLPQQEAAENDCSQVLFLDTVERRWVDELGGMNVYAVTNSNELITPPLGTILEGVTRKSILTLADEMGLSVKEQPIDVRQMLDGVASGGIAEMFACGTAAVVNPIGSFKSPEGHWQVNGGASGEVTMEIRRRLMDIQYGRAEDNHGWMHRIL